MLDAGWSNENAPRFVPTRPASRLLRESNADTSLAKPTPARTKKAPPAWGSGGAKGFDHAAQNYAVGK
jgi:hypothetical protein